MLLVRKTWPYSLLSLFLVIAVTEFLSYRHVMFFCLADVFVLVFIFPVPKIGYILTRILLQSFESCNGHRFRIC